MNIFYFDLSRLNLTKHSLIVNYILYQILFKYFIQEKKFVKINKISKHMTLMMDVAVLDRSHFRDEL